MGTTDTTARMLDQDQSVDENKLKQKWLQYWELIAAAISGLCILVGWILSRNDFENASIIVYLLAYAIGGFAKAKEGIIETIKNKTLNVELLMILAAIGSALIGFWAEGAILILIFAVSGALETYTMKKSHKEISALMDLQPEEALRVMNGQEERVLVSQLQVGDVLLIKPGERIPADGKILQGETYVDESAITGESVPVIKRVGDDVFAGTVNTRGSITIQMMKPNDESLFQKIIKLVQNAQSEKSPSQLFIEKFESTYVKVVLFAVGLMLFIPHYALGWSWTETFYRAMILLVVGSPCALVASIMPATLSAISYGAKHGILFKGGVHLEQLGHTSAIAFDKTGTLTKGEPAVTDIYARDDEKKLLQSVASIERYSNHPLAQSVVSYALTHNAGPFLDVRKSEDISGYGVQGILGDTLWKIGKRDFVGREEAISFRDGIAEKLASEGKTLIFAKDNLGIAGIIALKDCIREDTVAALTLLRSEGVKTFMLTGDNERTAHAIATECHLDGYVAECLPNQKVDEIKKLRRQFSTVAMVGDGINDAPALATASIGIAMGQGSDVALETADIVLMKNELPKIADAIQLSRRMNKIIKQNVIFSISVIMLLVLSNFLQIVDLPFGVIGHEGSTILVIANSLRLLKK